MQKKERKRETRVLPWAALTEMRLTNFSSFAGTSSKVTPKLLVSPSWQWVPRRTCPRSIINNSDHQIFYILLKDCLRKTFPKAELGPGRPLLTCVWQHLSAARLGKFGHKLDRSKYNVLVKWLVTSRRERQAEEGRTSSPCTNVFHPTL